VHPAKNNVREHSLWPTVTSTCGGGSPPPPRASASSLGASTIVHAGPSIPGPGRRRTRSPQLLLQLSGGVEEGVGEPEGGVVDAG
jgi:hypothetical protein